MNPKTLILPLLLALAITVTNAQPSPTPAPAPANSPAATRGADPFVKDPSASPSPDSQSEKPVGVIILRFTIEVYALAQADAVHILEGSTDGEARHTSVLALENKGKARLETLLSEVNKSGQRAVVEQVDEFRYPTSFFVSGTNSSPTDYETRNAGSTLEWEPMLSQDNKTCDMNMVPQTVRLAGFRDEAPGLKPAGQPIFETQKFTTAQILATGRNELLGTFSRAPREESPGADPQESEEVRLAFGRVDLVEIPPGKLLRSPDDSGTVEQRLTLFSMDRDAARNILAAPPAPGACYAAVQALVDQGKARLERTNVLITKTGQRAVVEEVREIRYAVFDNAADFETRNTGLTMEIEPTLGLYGIVDISIVPQLVQFVGDFQGSGPTGAAAKYPPSPLFRTRKITTALSAGLGEQAFLGTFSSPGDDGIEGERDDGKVWLAFLLTNLVHP